MTFLTNNSLEGNDFICQVFTTAVKFPERFSSQGPNSRACHEVNEAHEENNLKAVVRQ